jgi:Tol biopolymer transport system component
MKGIWMQRILRIILVIVLSVGGVGWTIQEQFSSEQPERPIQWTTTRVSVASDGTEGNGDSTWQSISHDGRFVAFISDATNLVAGDVNGVRDAFFHDRQTGETSLASVASDGTQGNGWSIRTAISADGRFIAFDSEASNLVEGDTNGAGDVFVHDRQTRETTRISVASDGTEGNNHSWWPSISGDGRFVAFQSLASNLVAGVTNGVFDVFVHDRQSGETIRVSVAKNGEEGNSFSVWPSISEDGGFVSFYSLADNLVEGDTNGVRDVFVRDIQSGETTRVSVSSAGTEADGDSFYSSISAGGRYVTFESMASNLVPGYEWKARDVYVHDRLTGETSLVSVTREGLKGNGESTSPSISADGRYVVFDSRASNLVDADTNEVGDVFLYDRDNGEIKRVSVSSEGVEGNGNSYFPSISADGRAVVFQSNSSNLVPGDNNEVIDIFVYEREADLINLYLPFLYKEG